MNTNNNNIDKMYTKRENYSHEKVLIAEPD